MIDWEVVLLLEPASILGTVVGGLMNKTFPVWLSMLLMLIFLVLTTARTVRSSSRYSLLLAHSCSLFSFPPSFSHPQFRKAIKLYKFESLRNLAEDQSVSPEPSSFRGCRGSASESNLAGMAEDKSTPAGMGRTLSYLDFATTEKHIEAEPASPGYEALEDSSPLVPSPVPAGFLGKGEGWYWTILPMVILQVIVGVLFLVKKVSR